MIIYKTTNLTNGKFYIGKDINNSEYYLGSGVLLKKSIKKYGKENFIKEILEHCETLDILDEREKFWVKELNAINLGYNLTEGGTGGDTFTNNINKEEIREKLKKRIYSEEVKKIKLKNLMLFQSGENHPNFGKKQSESTKEKRKKSFLESGITSPMSGKKHKEETKLKISQKNSGKPSHRKGKTHSDETKLKMRGRILSEETKQKMRGRKLSEETKQKMRGEELICPFCNKKGRGNPMKQWHFNNCKLK